MLAMPQSTERTSDTPAHAQLLELLGIQAIPLGEAQWGVEFDPRIELVEEREEDRGTGDSIHVVIAIDTNPALVDDRLGDPVGGFSHAGQGRRRVQSREGIIEKAPGRARFRDLPIQQELSDDGRDFRRGGQPLGRAGIDGKEMPEFLGSWHDPAPGSGAIRAIIG